MLAMPAFPPDPTIPTAPILVVDDDAKIVRLVRTYLEREGYRVVTAGDGPAALDAIETHAVDISDTIERGIESLRAHRAYLTGLGQDDPAGFLRGSAEAAATRFGGRLATTFELLVL